MRVPVVLILFSLLLSFLQGCVSPTYPRVYAVQLDGKPAVVAKDFTVSYPGFSHTIERLEKGAGITMMSIAAPMPDTAMCEWTGEDGVPVQTVGVPVKSRLPKEFRSAGEGLCFTVTEDDRIEFAVHLLEKPYTLKYVVLGVFPEQ